MRHTRSTWKHVTDSMNTKQKSKPTQTKSETVFVKETLEKLEPLKSWNEYNLNTYRVWQKDQNSKTFEPTNYQRIEYNGRFVNYMSLMYNVLPNEDVLKTADLVASVIDAKHSVPKQPKTTQKNNWCKPKGHVLSNPEETTMIAHYTIGDPIDITGAKDYVEFGFGVGNAIDGKGGAFKVFPYTYRAVCDNVAYHVANAATLHTGVSVPQLENTKKSFSFNIHSVSAADKTLLKKDPELEKCIEIVKNAKKEFNQVNFKKAHFSTLNLEYVTNSILTVVEQGKQLQKAYRDMYNTKVTLKNAQKLFDKIPKSIMTGTKVSQWLDYDKKDSKLTIKKDVTEWKAFNDITNELTFGNRGFKSTIEAYQKLDEILVAQH